MHDDLKKAIETLRNGGLILYPTDTVWGIGCDATNEEAVKRIYTLKQREDSKSMLVLLDSEAKLPAYMDEVPDMAWDLIELSEKPLTVIYPAAKNIASNLIAEDGTIGIRVSREDFSKRLCAGFKKPIVSTSANVSGELSPQNFNNISEDIKAGVDYVVNFRQDEIASSTPSSIMKLDVDGQIKIIRK